MLKKILLSVVCLLFLLFALGDANPGWQTAWQIIPDDSWEGSAGRNYRNVIPADSSSFDGTKIRITVGADATGGATLDGSSIGLMTTDDDMDNPANGTFKRITWVDAGGGNGITCAVGVSKVSDELTFDFDKTKRYGIHFNLVDRDNWLLNDTSGDGIYYLADSAPDNTLTQTVAYGWIADFTGVVTKLEVLEAEGDEENAIFFGINFLIVSLLLIRIKKKQ